MDMLLATLGPHVFPSDGVQLYIIRIISLYARIRLIFGSPTIELK